MEIDIRRIRPDEYDEAADLVRQVFDALVAASMEPAGAAVFAAFGAAEQIRARDARGAITHVAVDGEGLQGIVQVFEGHVVLFFTAAARHRQGIGRALFAAADACQAVRTVNSSTYAVSAYERLGFHPTGAEQVKDGVRFVPMARDGAASH